MLTVKSPVSPAYGQEKREPPPPPLRATFVTPPPPVHATVTSNSCCGCLHAHDDPVHATTLERCSDGGDRQFFFDMQVARVVPPPPRPSPPCPTPADPPPPPFPSPVLKTLPHCLENTNLQGITRFNFDASRHARQRRSSTRGCGEGCTHNRQCRLDI